jgi:UDP-N-acetyl-D-glucosamine dehydrogenase
VKIAVVALGKIGLPLAVQFASKGHEVVGVDVNADWSRSSTRAGSRSPVRQSSTTGSASSSRPGGCGRRPTTPRRSPGADAVVVVVPLFVDDETWQPDFGWMDSATRSIAEHLTSGTLVSYETTLPVGTTRTRWKPMLEEISGLTEGQDFHLVFSPSGSSPGGSSPTCASTPS